MNRILLALATMVTMAACEQIDSGDVDTDGISAEVEFVADGSGETRVTATLQAGGTGAAAYLELSEGDRLWAKTSRAEVSLRQREDVWGVVRHSATLSGDRPGQRMWVELRREEHPSATDTEATLPEPFTLRADARQVQVGQDDVTLSWGEGSADSIYVRAVGDCIDAFEDWVQTDDGRYTLKVGDLQAVEAGTTCPVEFTVDRVREGQLDARFEDGSVYAIQRRHVSIEATTPTF